MVAIADDIIDGSRAHAQIGSHSLGDLKVVEIQEAYSLSVGGLRKTTTHFLWVLKVIERRQITFFVIQGSFTSHAILMVIGLYHLV